MKREKPSYFVDSIPVTRISWLINDIGTKHFFEEMKHWGANVMRLPIHPRAWRKRGTPDYLNLLDQGVAWATELGLYFIIDAITKCCDEHEISYVVWVFDPHSAPRLFKDWDYTPSRHGAYFKEHMRNSIKEKIVLSGCGEDRTNL